MSNRLKRYRQISILESFTCSKRAKGNSVTPNENTDNQSDLSSATKNTAKMSSSSDIDDINTCEAVENSSLDVSADKQSKVDAEPSTVEEIIPSSLNLNENTNSVCPAAECSLLVESKSIDVINGPSSFNTKTEECYSGHQNSEDLFSGKTSSLEDYSVPSSSHSKELFVDSYNNDSSENATISEGSDSPELDHFPFFNRMPDCTLPLPKLEPLENHTILFSINSHPGIAPRPYPSSYRDKWDSDHVRMPCSPFNRYPVADSNEVKHIESRWSLICRSLRSEITSSQELEAAIMKYNSQYIDRWNFLGLHDFINKILEEGEREHFFDVILPVMIEMTLDLPNICTQPIPLLKEGKDHRLTMSQKQIGCLLLNAFFCTYPRRTLPHRRKKERWTCEYATYPDINFNRLFYGTKNGIPSQNAEKLKCLFNYFRRITAEEPTGTVTFHRQSLRNEDLPKWNSSTRGIRTAVIKSSGLIETDGYGMLQADFANKFVGGGVIGQGCVQEEIRFIICPELIISRLFVECLGNNEVLIITGIEQYNKYSGYSNTFKWEGNFIDETPRDSWGRRYTQLVAMDAISFSNPDMQFRLQLIRRELNKAYCAFYENAPPAHLPAVATGNWGCGAFKGSPNLKFLIQLMAASQAGRSLLYFTFGNIKLKKQLQDMYDFLNEKNITVGDVWRLLMRYDESASLCNKTKYSNLYEFIYAQFLTKGENCRHQDEEYHLDNGDKRAAQALIEDLACGDSSKSLEDNT